MQTFVSFLYLLFLRLSLSADYGCLLFQPNFKSVFFSYPLLSLQITVTLIRSPLVLNPSIQNLTILETHVSSLLCTSILIYSKSPD